MELKDICQYISEKVATTTLTKENYISTENMLPDKGGIVTASGVPFGNSIAFSVGDVLVSNIRPYFKKIWQANRNGGCSADVLCFRANSNVDNSYFYYLLSQQEFFDYVMSGAKGCKMPRGDKRQIMQWKVELPPLDEQRHIASVLLSLDDKIELNRRINGNLEQQAQALFKAWFVDFEPFKDGKFVDSELGMIPEGWKVGNLSDIANITMGQSPDGKSYNECGDGMIFYQGRAEFGYRFPYVRLYTTQPKKIAEPLSILLSVRAPVGDINIAYYKCCIGRGLAAIQCTNKCQSFLFYLIQSLKPIFNQYNGEGTVFGSISKEALSNIRIVIPKIEVINRFESIAKNIDRLILQYFLQIKNLESLRDTLLPRLMSGELNVNTITE